MNHREMETQSSKNKAKVKWQRAKMKEESLFAFSLPAAFRLLLSVFAFLCLCGE